MNWPKKRGAGKLTLEQTASAVRQRQGKMKSKSRKHATSILDRKRVGEVSVSANKRGDYHDIEQALQEALDEVQHRLANNVTTLQLMSSLTSLTKFPYSLVAGFC